MFVDFKNDGFLLRGQTVLVVDAFFETALQNVLVRGSLVESKVLVAVWANTHKLLIRDAVLQRDFVMKLHRLQRRRALRAFAVLFI